MASRSKRDKRERYDISQSPFAQRPTQKEVAKLLRESRDDLRALAAYKEQFIVRRTTETGKNGRKKIRNLAYPENRLRRVHEILKFHLNKIKQPSYLFSPRKGKSQRDNAERHLDQLQVLTFDIKKFYPSTTATMVKRWLVEELNMYPDVAGLITRLATVDDKVSLGSPLTPVLCTLVHRKMFDEIADLCVARGLRYSLWVDDVTISGRFVPGDFLVAIREIVRRHGLKTHKIKFLTNSRPVFITGVGVLADKLVTPNRINLKLRMLFSQYHLAQTFDEKEDLVQKLLSTLGSAKYMVGQSSAHGQKIAGQMNTLRQEINKQRADDCRKLVASRTIDPNVTEPPPF